MQDDKKIPNEMETTDAKPIEQTAKSGQQDTRSPSPTQATRRKRLYILGVIAVILVSAIPVIGFLRQSETAKRFEGLVVAFCAIGWGIFLIRHFVQVVEEEDEVEEETRLRDEAAQQTNPTTPPSEPG